MKNDVHPKYNSQVKVACSCGNTFVTGSTLDAIQIEICSKCHPFYTGQQKLIDTAGRVDKFQERAAKQAGLAATRKGKKAKRVAQTAKAKAEETAESK
ncbi:MAG: 50S ribosomal protein L31 [Parcubacteria group bacterium]|nr:50S ribosomal protein L31 [Parcubacteria group bacterium]